MTKAEATLAAKKLTAKTVEVMNVLARNSGTKSADLKKQFPRWGHAKKALTDRGWLLHTKGTDTFRLNNDGKKVLRAV